MAIVITQLSVPAYLGSSAAAILTHSSGKTYVRGLVLHNTNTTTESVTIYWVQPSGGSVGTAAASDQILKVSLAADETFVFEVPGTPFVLDAANETLQGFSTTASKVTCFVTGGTE